MQTYRHTYRQLQGHSSEKLQFCTQTEGVFHETPPPKKTPLLSFSYHCYVY